MKVLQSSSKDIPILVPLRHKLWPHVSLDEHRKELEAEFSNKTFLSFYLMDGTKVVAFAEYNVRSHANGCNFAPVLYLEGVWVAPDYRRQGLAQKLVEAGEQYARDNQIQGLASDALFENVDSQKAHIAWGFKETERTVCYGKKLL